MLLAVALSVALADDPVSPGDPAAPPPEATPPVEPASPTQPAPPAKKPPKEWQWAALPIANVSSTTGVGYGAYAAVVHSAEAGSEEPFRARVSMQIFFTTKKYMDHNLKLDVPNMFGSGVRWDLLVGYEAWKQATYFGEGNYLPILQDPPVIPPPTGEDPLPKDAYYQYDVRWFRGLTNVRKTIHGPWQVFGGYMLRLARVNPYEGSLLDVQRPLGVEGGNTARLSGGVMVDTRDAEPSPHAGTFSEASIRLSAPFVGSKWTAFGFNVTDRHWLSLDADGKLVLATRVIVDGHYGDEPFFTRQLLGGSSFVTFGGSNNLRGLAEGRYTGDWAVLLTPELRWTWITAGTLDIMAVPYIDMGRVGIWPRNPGLDDNLTTDDSPLHWHYAAGLGNRFQLGQSMLVRVDVGYALEEYAPLSAGPGDPVAPEDVVRKGKFGFYLVFDHPF
jgi:hypothetical protein